ncbi:hypothetical protein GE09DRAFT_11427 [Coniochaeta sp. 2T2.1]|nr:hypothetical protein GE09DRAFT_11427 [Coniochaeta sp. 2T2.1]
MHPRRSLLAVAASASVVHGLLRFSCSSLVIDRLDPLVNPGMAPSPHLHQIVGGNGFNITMDPEKDISSVATCTTCTFAEDFSNYWTAVLYFRARNGSYKRVPLLPNVGFEQADGGMTIYYSPEAKGTTTAFKPGFRMLVGNPSARTKAQADQYRQLTYTCLQTAMTRTGETKDLPTKPCPAGIMANIRFPTCWDGRNLDSPDHMSHVAYPATGTFENNGPCPATHPVQIPQLFYEAIWDTRKFNDKSLWPEAGSEHAQPFVWSYGDATGYGTHGDYVFGWKGDALQKAMSQNCNINCPALKTQSIAVGNKCGVTQKVKEETEGWLSKLPGGMGVM